MSDALTSASSGLAGGTLFCAIAGMASRSSKASLPTRRAIADIMHSPPPHDTPATPTRLIDEIDCFFPLYCHHLWCEFGFHPLFPRGGRDREFHHGRRALPRHAAHPVGRRRAARG